jgi:16S rRNA C967 or C1407 C5-methylase (RsmB/RsmF family)
MIIKSIIANFTYTTCGQLLAEAKTSEKDGLLDVSSFLPGLFDKILLDPPCSALGLRPKLTVPETRGKDLMAHANYQKRFFREAVDLLRSGGIMTYSTCSIHAMENEANVRWLLDEFPTQMELVPIEIECGGGSPGLAGYGLNDWERQCVRRFDSFVDDDDVDDDDDVMGFFIAKFRKKETLPHKKEVSTKPAR